MKKTSLIKLSIVVVAIALIIALYFLTPLREYLTVDKVVELTEDVPQTLGTALVFLGLFFVGGALLVPIPLLAFSVSLVFNLWVSVLICIPGFFLASLSGYCVGRLVDTDSFGDKVNRHLNNLRDKVDGKGPWAVFALRMAPTPPFTITSIIGGSLHIKLWKYALGSTLGIMPLGLSAALFGQGALKLMQEPSTMAVSFLVAAAILYGLYHVVKKKNAPDNTD